MSARTELLRLAARDGHVSPQSVLEEARPPSSPLHRHFTWDDTVAAEKCRLIEASQLIRRYSIEIETGPEKTVRTRALVNVAPAEYVPVEQAMADPNMRNVVLQSAIKELAALRRKYEHLCDFDVAIQASAAQKKRRRATA